MEEETGDMSSGFVRQRRNLILVSLMILLLSQGILDIKDLKIFDMSVKPEHANKLFISIWLVFIYFSWRYVQYCLKESNFCLRAEFHLRLDDLARKFIIREAANHIMEHPSKISVDGIDLSKLEKTSFRIRSGKVRLGDRNVYKEVLYEPFTFDVMWLFPEYIRAWLFVIFSRTVFTDYVVPGLLALAVLVIGLFGDWGGAWRNI